MTNDEPFDGVTLETGTNPNHTVIWLHGLGADGHDFVDVVPQLKLPPHTPVRFLFPHAPKIPVTINNGFVMRAWYDIKNMDFCDRTDNDHIDRSCDRIKKIVDRQIREGMRSENIMLAGFSQGGVIALHLGLRLPYKIAGIVVLSSYVPDEARLLPAEKSVNGATPIFIGHGTSDAILPFFLGTTMDNRLTELGYSVRFTEYPMPHSICAKEIDDVSRFMVERLAATTS